MSNTSAAEKFSPSPGWPGIVRRWLPTLLWVAMLCVLSTSSFSASHTAPLARTLFRLMHSFGLRSVTLASANLLLRKGTHFILYVLFFLILIHGPLRGRPALALLVCVVAGALDETHQIFLPARTASVYDVMLDGTGALCGYFIEMLLSASDTNVQAQSR